jgi:hypothetical protein
MTQDAHAGGPGDVYNDFAQDGVLSCTHSRADLEGVLHSGSINQYGDPLVLARLKLAIRKQLAGGCMPRHASQQKRNAGATGVANAGEGEFVAQRALLGGLVIAVLAIGGWLTKQALVRRD